MPILSKHINKRVPSSIRAASIRYADRTDGVKAINVAIGNISLPMHPAMIDRLHNLGREDSPFVDGKVMYSGTVGFDETREAFKKVIAASDCPTDGLYVQVTDGGSQAMELMIIACCGSAGTEEAPLLMIDAAYTNYRSFTERLGRNLVTFTRSLSDDGDFTLPAIKDIEFLIQEKQPHALVVIPYDNPTGQLYTKDMLIELGRLCVKYDMWMVSDEAYRELFYTDDKPISIWSLTEEDVPGIVGRRLSIETSSKVWNACGLRVGALVTDSHEMHTRCVAENTVSLCTNTVGQWVFGALAQLSIDEIKAWFKKQRDYYQPMMDVFARGMKKYLPDVTVSKPSAALYEVVDLRKVVGPDFNPQDFVMWCASDGAVDLDGELYTLLTAPLPDFYAHRIGHANPGRTQLRVAFVAEPEVMEKVPYLFCQLLKQYLACHEDEQLKLAPDVII